MAGTEMKLEIPQSIIREVVQAQVVAALGKSEQLIAGVVASANAVKAALQNAQARSEGSIARGQGEQPFVCATVGLRINDLAAVIARQGRLEEAIFSLNLVLDGLAEQLEVTGEKEPERLADAIDALKADVEKLTAFKKYVHERLDKAGVPANPDPPRHAKRVVEFWTARRDEERLSWSDIEDAVEHERGHRGRGSGVVPRDVRGSPVSTPTKMAAIRAELNLRGDL